MPPAELLAIHVGKAHPSIVFVLGAQRKMRFAHPSITSVLLPCSCIQLSFLVLLSLL